MNATLGIHQVSLLCSHNNEIEIPIVVNTL